MSGHNIWWAKEWVVSPSLQTQEVEFEGWPDWFLLLSLDAPAASSPSPEQQSCFASAALLKVKEQPRPGGGGGGSQHCCHLTFTL